MELVYQKGENHKTHEGLIYRLDRILINCAESCRGRIHLMNNDLKITGNQDHALDPPKIEMKQSLSEVRQSLSQ